MVSEVIGPLPQIALEAQLKVLQVQEGEPAKGKNRGRARNAPKFDLPTQLFRMCGVDTSGGCLLAWTNPKP